MDKTIANPYINKMFAITQEEVDAVHKVLSTPRYPIYGEQIENFEKEFAEYVGTKYAVAVSSGTAGLHLAYIACDFKPGDEIITQSHSFYSVTDMMIFQGVKPVFCDIDEESFTMDPNDAQQKVTSKTKALVPTHLNGHPSDMGPIMDLASDNNLIVIENAAHALGARYKSKKVGTFGDLNMFSFAPGKHVTTMGDGGMVTTDNEELAQKVKMLHNHGRGQVMKKIDKRGFPLHLGNDLLGYNYRMSEIDAAIGRVQLKRFMNGKAGPEIRRDHVREFEKLFEGTPVTIPVEKDWAYHSFCRFVTKVPNRDELWLFLKKNGIRGGMPYSPPIHLNRTYRDRFGFKKGMLPVTEKVTKELLSFPLRRIVEYLPPENSEKISDSIHKFYNEKQN